jgi:cytochrome c553
MSATAKQFYFMEPSAIDRYRKRSAGHWACVKCHEQAATEHKNPRRPRCSDRSDCGQDCTLSRVICRKCGAFEDK